MLSPARRLQSVPQYTASTEAVNRTTVSPQGPSIWKGVAFAAVIAAVAMLLGRWVPTVGGPVFAILIGVVWRNSLGLKAPLVPGIAFASRKLLQWSIIGLGFGLSFKQVVQTGAESLWVTLITIAVAFIVAFFLGKALGVSRNMRNLIGAGTAICGGSAIAAVAPIIKPEDHEMAFAISTIFLFNVVAVVTFPVIGHAFQMSDLGFGLWAGTAINDTSSVVAAAYSYSTTAGDYATIVKLTRASMIIPLCLLMAFLQAREDRKTGKSLDLKRIVPWFILGFLLATLVRSSGLLPEAWLPGLQQVSLFLMVMALAAVGLSTNLRSIANTGWKPVALGLGVWMAVSISSLIVQYLGGNW
ncbi:YeiH family protein [Paenalcaligenes niemegkensis]|uniref:YeiH family protein n=1 Tax=Paenalcaligenes niemegkensis TaxID=2895469 RepID=UPI001EE7F9DD|nr:YeiH family protein [Paenalcaligenes niemegkensis]MCQ9615960.1 YeiH family protein [Paenalcaligenes niemegkensis]